MWVSCFGSPVCQLKRKEIKNRFARLDFFVLCFHSAHNPGAPCVHLFTRCSKEKTCLSFILALLKVPASASPAARLGRYGRTNHTQLRLLPHCVRLARSSSRAERANPRQSGEKVSWQYKKKGRTSLGPLTFMDLRGAKGSLSVRL